MQVLDRIFRQPPTVIEPEVVAPLRTSLTAGAGTSRVSREDLSLIALPQPTDTFKPIHHALLIDELEKALAFRHIRIVSGDYVISQDGMKFFCLLILNADYEGVMFALGLRNANNRSMRLGMVAGYQVKVCTNMMLSGDFKPMLSKHSKHFDLVESLSIGIDRIQRQWEPLRRSILGKQQLHLSGEDARSIIYRAFMQERFPIKLMKSVHREFFVAPSYDEFREPTLWSLENSFTTAFKQLNPINQFEQTARLGKFLAPYTQ